MYQEFSFYYDLLTFDINYEFYANSIVQALEKRGIKEGRILEIACGTGNLTKHLAEKNFDILAFDNSEEMLNVAYPKLMDFDNVSIIKQDMFKFPYENFEFDAVISLLDVINYIRKEEDIERLFKKVYSSLKSGGMFIFDLNSENKLKSVLGNNTYVYEKDNVFYTWENSLKCDEVSFILNFFVEEDGVYHRFEERQVERYYSNEFIVEMLKNAGFTNIHFFDEDNGKVYKEGKTQRILFEAQRPWSLDLLHKNSYKNSW